MKIAFVRTASNILKLGGYNIQEIGLAKALLKYGISTDVYARFSNVDSTTEVAEESGNKVVIHPLHGYQIYHEIVYYPTLNSDLCNGHYDMVQLLDDSQMMLPFIFKNLKKHGVKTILWQGMYRNFPGKAARLMQIVYDALMAKTLDKYSDIKIAKTKTAAEYLKKKNYHNISVLPVGLDYVEPKYNAELEKQVADFANRHKKVLLYIGAIEPRRNPEFLLDIIAKLKSDGYGLILIGKGVSRNMIDSEIKSKGLSSDILSFNSVQNNELEVVYKASDLFLLPTNYEIYGMVVMESLYYGVPVLSTKEAGPKEILTEKVYGVCRPSDMDTWIKEIKSLCSVEKSASNVAKRRDYINKNFRWEKIADAYYKLLKEKEIF